MPQSGELTITGRPAAGGVEVAVADTGVAILPEQLQRIMEPLYSTKARGLGLGLSIARAVLEKNGGSLSVASALGRGSTFTVFSCRPNSTGRNVEHERRSGHRPR